MHSQQSKCNICSNESKILFRDLILNKHQIAYYRCSSCHFIQTEKPFWLDEAYGNAITDLDVGLVRRNIEYAKSIGKVIKSNFNYKGKFLDYAGGYGLFVRLMRDSGFDFYWDDKYCDNIFAQNHVLGGTKNKFEILTALEVFEHLEKPVEEIEKMFSYSDSIIFSTELQPKKDFKSGDDWWYFAPETGQHISFYSLESLEYLAKKFNCYFYTNGLNFHLLTKNNFKDNPLEVKKSKNSSKSGTIGSLTQSDFDFAKEVIKKHKKIKHNHQIKEKKDKDIAGELAIVYAKNDSLENQLAGIYSENENIKSELVSTQSELQTTQSELQTTQSELQTTQSELQTTKTKLTATQTELASTQSELQTTKTKLTATQTELHTTQSELSSTQTELQTIKTELANVYGSRKWKVITKLVNMAEKIALNGSYRRKITIGLWRVIKPFLGIAKKSSNKVHSLKDYFEKLKPRKKRKINKKSKKIVYIGHSYHDKTKSTKFLTDYLSQFYDVQIVLDESWQGKPFPDLSFIDESYLGVIFFQNLPDKETLKNIKNNNLIFFPMYDGVRHDFEFWNERRDLKVINFSQTLHNKLKQWGLQSIFIQYFPDIQKFQPGPKNKAFFWQRLTKINVNTVSKLFGEEKISLHIHKAVDPCNEFTKPSNKDQKKFQITYSDWFKTRGEMWDLIKQKGIYVAPREYEGIGQSFLEAMSMGKAVIAVDNPTMNEYIKNGKTGYLFNLKNPKKINLTNIEEVQKNTYKFMKEGYKKWQKDKKIIIDFILSK